MLTSFFSKSKPINFIVVALFLILACFYFLFSERILDVSTHFLLKQIGTVIACLFLLFLLNFIIKKNKLTQNNTYPILFFSTFIIMLPIVIQDNKMVFANIFLLLALRRIISLPSNINTQKKILDASIWISVAALFYFWSLLFFVVLFLSIVQTNVKNPKYFLIPLMGFISVFVLATVYYLLVSDSFLWFLDLNTSIGFVFSDYKSLLLLIPALLLGVLLILSFYQKRINNSTIPLKEKSKYWTLTHYLLISLLIIVIAPIKNGSELLFAFAPLAIFTTNFIEKTPIFWIKESLLWLVLLISVLIYFL